MLAPNQLQQFGCIDIAIVFLFNVSNQLGKSLAQDMEFQYPAVSGLTVLCGNVEEIENNNAGWAQRSGVRGIDVNKTTPKARRRGSRLSSQHFGRPRRVDHEAKRSRPAWSTW